MPIIQDAATPMTAESDKLRECPFCGGKAIKLRSLPSEGELIGCVQCGGIEVEAAVWNRRADDALLRRIEHYICQVVAANRLMKPQHLLDDIRAAIKESRRD